MRMSFSLMKTSTYAVMHMVVAIAVAYVLSGSWKIALSIGLIEPVVQTFCFFFHEKAWHKAEKRMKVKDYHDGVIDSTGPVVTWVERILRHRH
jgi:uncharacterized membrane protein